MNEPRIARRRSGRSSTAPLAADQGWLSPTHDRDERRHLRSTRTPSLPYATLFGDVEPVFREHGGRPHWGKIHNLKAPRPGAALPDLGALPRRCAAASTPTACFLNDHLRDLFGA